MTFKEVLEKHGFKFSYIHSNGKTKLYYRKSDKKYAAMREVSWRSNTSNVGLGTSKYYYPVDLDNALKKIEIRQVMRS